MTKDAKIKFENVNLSYPIYENAGSRSLKSTILNLRVGGKINHKSKIPQVKALSDLSFELKEGDKLGLIGHNGAGKTTLMRSIAGIYTPNSGNYIIQGSVQCMLDVYMGLDPMLTGFENIKVRAVLLGIKKKNIPNLIEDIAEFTELGDFLAVPVRTYSSGMQLRLAFALSTAVHADILAIDEVIGTGDASFRAKAEVRLTEFMHKAKIVLMSSHENEVIRKHCNKVMWLEHGEVKMLGDSEEVLIAYEKND